MSIPVDCPGCGKRYKVGDNLAGQRVRCGCGKTLFVPNSRPPQAGEVVADEIPDDLLDETIWDSETPAETMEANADVAPSPVAKLAPGVPAVADNRPRPTETDPTETEDSDDEPETFWDRVKSPSRELIGWLAIAYGGWMCFCSVAAIGLLGLTLPFLIILVLSLLTIAGGVLIKKRHPLGPSFAGLGSAGITFFVLMSTLLCMFPLHVFLVIFAVEYVFFYSAPTYIIYWCLKEEEAIDEAARRDDFYVIRDSLKDRAIEENRKEWESK